MPYPGHLPPGKTQYPLYKRLGGPQGQSEWVWKISPPTRFNPWTVQPVVSRYTDCAIPIEDIITKWSEVTGHMIRMEETKVDKRICKASQKAEEK
jgi:hypothetical protein